MPIAQGQRKFAHGDEMVSTTIMHRIPTLEVAVTPRCADAAIRPNNTVAWGLGTRTVFPMANYITKFIKPSAAP